jgi:DDE superfamily endonuclease
MVTLPTCSVLFPLYITKVARACQYLFRCLATMKFGLSEKRVAIIALFKCGKSAKEIYQLLKPLPINERFVFRTLRRYKESSDIEDKPREGRPRSVRLKNVIHAVRERVRRNPLRKQKRLAVEMNVSKRSMSRILREDLQLGAYRRCVSHLLTPRLKKIRAERCKKLLKRFKNKGHRRILFSDEKIFTIEEKINRQNDRVYAKSCYEANEKAPRVTRAHHPPSVMVWWGVSYDGATKIHFCDAGVKTNAAVYECMLDDVVKPLNHSLFENEDNWCFQQDSAPAHKARRIQTWLAENLPDFITANDWPSGSPDLNPLDYSLWTKLEERACAHSHRNLDSLKKSIVKAARELPLETIRESIDEWPKRLRLCVKKRGDHFE